MADKQPLIKLNPIPDEITNALLKPAADTLGNAANDILSAGFNLILTPLRKYNIRSDKELKDFADKINAETSSIPDVHRDGSKVSLILKAVDDSKYRLDDEFMREAFARLIARGLDNRAKTHFYPAYSDMLANMSVDEAVFLTKLVHNTAKRLPTGKVNLKAKDNSTRTKSPIIPLWDNPREYNSNFSISIDLLKGTGLIDVLSDAWLTSKHFENLYKEFENSSSFALYAANGRNEGEVAELEKGYIKLTDVGDSFVRFIV